MLLKRCLDVAAQQRVVDACDATSKRCAADPERDEGGFVFPLLETGQPYAMRMMCCGVHWNSRTHRYVQRRSNIDGKNVPPIPPLLRKLCDDCLVCARNIDETLVTMQPNSLLVNFFEPGGWLGLHRDDDENPETLEARLPVVSVTVGDSMEFYWLDPEDETQERSVRLESGDVIVFGGESRLIKHASRKVQTNSRPPGLKMREGRLNLTFRQTSFTPVPIF